MRVVKSETVKDLAASAARLNRHELPRVCPNCKELEPQWNIGGEMLDGEVRSHHFNCRSCGYDISRAEPDATRRYVKREML